VRDEYGDIDELALQRAELEAHQHNAGV
jgi:hypothetical protein